MSDLHIDLTNVKNTLSPGFRWLLADANRFKVLVGGAGSGKSWSIAITILYKILRDWNSASHKVLCLRKTSPAARNSVFSLFTKLIEDWNLEKLISVNKTDMTITFLNKSKILVGGMDDQSKIKSIEGLTSIWLEEASEHIKETYMQCNIRLRGESKVLYEIYLSTNPISKSIFVYKDFVLNKTEDAIVHSSTFLDNTFIDTDYKEQLEKLAEKDPLWHKVYMLGKWCDPEGTIFNNWETVEKISEHYAEGDKSYGLDFGYVHPTAVVSVIKDDGALYIEELLCKSKMTNADLIGWIKKNIPPGSVIYADSAEPSKIEEIRQAGIDVRKAIKGPDSIRNSIDYLNRYKMFVSESSVNMVNELQNYRWRTDKDGNVFDKPIDVNDDLIAALRYAVYSRYGNEKKYEVIF